MAMLVLACPEVSWYHHEPTRHLFESYALDDPQLAPFKLGDVVVKATIVQGHAEVALTFLSKIPATVHLRRVVFDGVVIEVDQTIAIEDKSKKADAFVEQQRFKVTGVESGSPFEALGRDGYQVVVETDEGSSNTLSPARPPTSPAARAGELGLRCDGVFAAGRRCLEPWPRTLRPRGEPRLRCQRVSPRRERIVLIVSSSRALPFMQQLI